VDDSGQRQLKQPAALSALPDFVEALGHGIYLVDTGFHRPAFDAAYLIVHEGRAAFIDSGTNFSVPHLLQALQALGLNTAAVDWVIPTHVHLDHAGGVGLLMRELPTARLLVHPRGARHLIDPSALWSGATEVYGAEEMARSYGELVPVEASRVVESADGTIVNLAGRELLIAHTPGHARHHHCIWDVSTRGWFTGDTFGLSYREFDTAQGPWIMPTTTPVQFEPEALRVSVQRLLAQDPACLYLTHYGRVCEVQRLGDQFLGLLDQVVALGRRCDASVPAGPARVAALQRELLDLYAASLASHGSTCTRAQLAQWLAIDLELNAQGMAIWLARS